jgi:integrase
MLAAHRNYCRKRAEQGGGGLEEDGYVFSPDLFGELPCRPDTVGHWFRNVAEATGVHASLNSLCHCNASQMLAGGINLRAAAGRLSRSGGGYITLPTYAHRTRASDRRVTDLLTRQLRPEPGR